MREDGPAPVEVNLAEAVASSDLWRARTSLIDSILWALCLAKNRRSAIEDTRAICSSASSLDPGVSRNPTKLIGLMRCPRRNSPYSKRLASVTKNFKFISSSESPLMSLNLST